MYLIFNLLLDNLILWVIVLENIFFVSCLLMDIQLLSSFSVISNTNVDISVR